MIVETVVLNGYTENPGDLNWGDLERLGEVTVHGRTPSKLVVERAGNAEVILVNKVAVAEEVLRQCGNIRYIEALAMGYNVIDTVVASARGIVACNIPSYGADAVRQYAIALLLEICHHIGHRTEAVKQGAQSASGGWCFWDYPLIELVGRAMGIIGYGRTGRTTERITRALGMRMLTYEGEEKARQEEEFANLEMLLAQSDAISPYCLLFPSTEGIIDRETIGKMKDGAILLDDSRGPLIVKQDLANALNYGKVHAAGPDAASTESIRPDNPLLGAKNCLITPHTAWVPKKNQQCLMNIAVENLYSFQVGEPVDMVNGQRRETISFRNDFVQGAATNACQIEGVTFEDGKGKPIWDVYAHLPDKVLKGEHGDVAYDHYYRSEEGMKLMAELKISTYQFSISWPRVTPEGTGPVNEKGILFYSRLVDCLLSHEITPYVTLYHQDQPYELYKKGGWLNPDSPKWFAEYTRTVEEVLGDRVKHFITFNEPQVFTGLAFVNGVHASGHRISRAETLLMAHRVLLAHGMVSQVPCTCVSEVQVGYVPTPDAPIPVSDSPKHVAAARDAYSAVPGNGDWNRNVSWWNDPMMLGHYPEDGLRILGPDLPPIHQDDMKTIFQRPDFYGQNICRGIPVSVAGNGTSNRVGDGADGWHEEKHSPGSSKIAIGWPVDFDCPYWGVEFLYERYQIPISVTENGMPNHSWSFLDDEVHDPTRIDHLHHHLHGLCRAAEDGVDIADYFQWSLMDNLEWTRGYNDHFGLVYADFETQRRPPKDSPYWYRDAIRGNGENS